MKRIHLNRIILLAVGAVAIATAFTACKDDHFDIPEGGEGTGSVATETLWELIESNESLSNFARIAAQTPAFKDEKHPIEGYTFKDVLSDNQVLTVFAPDNEAFTAADVQEMERLLQESPYDVFLRLAGNHITTSRYVASGLNPKGEAERIIFLNNKKGYFDREKKTIKEIHLKTANLHATNGVLHIISQQVPFNYNLYEYIRATKEFKHLNEWISQHDTLYFNSNLSAIAGTDNETGEPIYVDSVYTRFNSLYYYSYQPNSVEWSMPHKGIAANIEQEDSIWAMIVPTDAAWEEAVETMRPWYEYAETYFDMSQEDNALINNTVANRKTLQVKNPDYAGIIEVMRDSAISMDIVSSLVFNARQQRYDRTQTEFLTVESFLEHNFNRLFNTRLDTFYMHNPEEDVRNFLCEGKEPVRVSNGLAYPVDHWNFRKTDKASWVEIEATPATIYQRVRYNLTEAEQKDKEHYTYNGDWIQWTIDNSSELTEKYGKVYKGTFLDFSIATGVPKATFKLRGNEADQQVMSGIEYEIGLVMVPDFYRTLMDPEENPEAIKKNRIIVSITYLSDNKKEKTMTAKYFDYAGEKVDTVWINETLTFPYSYRNLNKAYPVLQVTSANIANDLIKQGFQNRFYIDQIFLRPKQAAASDE